MHRVNYSTQYQPYFCHFFDLALPLLGEGQLILSYGTMCKCEITCQY